MLHRRLFLQGKLSLPFFAGWFGQGRAAPKPRRDFFQELKVRPFINAAEPFTALSGSLIPAEITEVKADEVPASRPASETESSLADLEAKLASDFPPADPAKSKLESAAAERKRARRISKKQHEVVWEPADDASYRLYYLVVLLVFVAAAAIVFFTVFLK